MPQRPSPPSIFDGGPSTVERSAYILLKNNCTLSSGRHHRAPVGALASELGLFDGHETALANALVAATYQAIADGERDAGAVCRAMGLVSQLANASASSITAWPHEAAECIDATRRMTESQRMTRLQFFLEDGVVAAAEIREKTLVLSKQESWLSIDCALAHRVPTRCSATWAGEDLGTGAHAWNGAGPV